MSLMEDFSKFLITNQKIDFASKRQRVQLKKNHEELKKNSQLIEKWRRFSLRGGGKTPPPGTDRVNENCKICEFFQYTFSVFKEFLSMEN